jgi:diaminopimelate epimerase
MKLRFAKYHGIGNDFVMLADPQDQLTLTPELVRALADRRFGIGGDGVIRVAPGRNGAELFMDYVNSDGSVGEMCGNGIRCLGLFARSEGLSTSDELKVETRSGLKIVWVEGDVVRVDMGPPAFAPASIPVKAGGTDALHLRVSPGPGFDDVEVACVSMGNPHAVMIVNEPASAPVTTLGPALETASVFSSKTNVEFMRIDSRDHITMRVWERGSGETLACGTGACAVVVVARVLGHTDERVTVALPGGELTVEWAGSLETEAPVFLAGPAVRVYDGIIDLDTLEIGAS